MRVRLVKKKTINKFMLDNANSRSAFTEWLDKLKHANWVNTNDIKETYRTADIIGKRSNRIVFNIGGNNYRMICSFHFGRKNVHLFINWIGTHAEYTKLCDDNLQYNINLY